VNGVAETTLSVNNQYTGNNYRLEASIADSGIFIPLAVSPVYTTWRRGYLEHDLMWRAGAWIVADSGFAEPEPMRVHVSDASSFAIGDTVHLLSGDSFETAAGEFGTVAAVGPSWVDVDTDFGTGVAGLRFTYRSAGSPPPGDQEPYSFLARVDQGAYDSSPKTSTLAIAFDDAFAEWIVLPTTGFVPFWPTVPAGSDDPEFLSQRSPQFFNALSAPDRSPILNTIQLVSAAGAEGALGLTGGDSNYSWIFLDTIADFFPSSVVSVRESTTAHELAHQFNVNSATPDAHDEEDAWTPPGALCLMNISRDRTLGVAKMHSPAGASTQDLMCIRSHIDDLDNSILCSVP
jgi:hypothetical protein